MHVTDDARKALEQRQLGLFSQGNCTWHLCQLLFAYNKLPKTSPVCESPYNFFKIVTIL